MLDLEESPSAILLASCPDRPDILATITNFVSEHGGNILEFDEHVEKVEGVFLVRIEWDLSSFTLPRDRIGACFRQIADRFSMNWSLHFSGEMPRMALFATRQSHCLHDLLARWESNEWQVSIPVIISNHELLRPIAERFNIDYYHTPITEETKQEKESRQLEILDKYDVDFVVLARYMQILTSQFIDEYEHKIINIHHSFLPAFPGAKPYSSAHERGGQDDWCHEPLCDGRARRGAHHRTGHRSGVARRRRRGPPAKRVGPRTGRPRTCRLESPPATHPRVRQSHRRLRLDPQDVQDSSIRNGIQTILGDPRFELLPFDGFEEALQELPAEARVAITASPQLGIEATIETSIQAANRGFDATPHLAARYVRDEMHLRDIASRLTEAGVTALFVPAGDLDTPEGPYASAHDLLVALEKLEYEFEEIGITGYPEGHPFLDEGTLGEAMQKKAPFATYVVTQICFDADKILDWIQKVRHQRAVHLPIEVGIPGVLKHTHLLQIARQVGVGNSMRFLQKTTGILEFGRQLMGSWTKYSPDALVEGLAPYVTDPEVNLRGLHLYTFNQVRDTEEWRSERHRESQATAD